MDHPYAVTRLGAMLPDAGVPLFVNQPWHADPTPFHDHDFIEVAVVVGGGAVHRGVHGERAVGRGDVIVLHPGQWHGYVRCSEVQLYNLGMPAALFAHELAWLLADPQIAALLPPMKLPPMRAASAMPAPQQVIHLHLGEGDLEAVRAALERLMVLIAAPAAIRSRAETIALAAVVMARLGAAAPRRHVPAQDDVAVATIAAAMEADLARPWKLADLARRGGMSREHLCRRFRAVLGAPPLAWLTRRRAERAAVLLLSTDGAVAAIGREVGWDDPNYCARRFRAAFGVNPAAYRKRVPVIRE